MKKTSFRVISLVLTILMVFYAIPFEGFAKVPYDDELEPYASNEIDTYFDDSESEEDDPILVLHEEKDLREYNMKRFRMTNGSFTAVQCDEAIHFEDENGEWQDIDNTLVQDNSSLNAKKYENTSSDIKYVFEGTPEDGQVTAKYNDYFVSFKYKEKDIFDKKRSAEDFENEEIIDETEIPDNSVETTDSIDNIESADESDVDTESIEDNFDSIDDTANTENDIEISDPEVAFNEKTDSSYTIEITNPQGANPNKSGALDNEKDDTDGIVKPISLEKATENIKIFSEIKYTNKEKGLAFKYNLSGENLKESIILNNQSDDYTYSFDLNINDLSPVMRDDGSIVLCKNDGKEVFVIATPYMVDAKDNISFDVKYQIEKNSDGKYTLSVIADPSWINQQERSFPVTIDPTVLVVRDANNANFNIKYRLGSGTIYTNNLANRMGQNGSAEYISFMHIPTLPTLPNNCIPVRAFVSYYQNAYTKSNSTYSPNQFIVAVREATSSNTWYNNPKTNDIMDYQVVKSGNTGYLTWDITESVQKWYSGTTNNGVVFTNETVFSGSYGSYATFYGNNASSAYLPYVAINYRNTVGIEGYYSYLTQNVSRAGTGYVRLNDGKMTFSKGDLSNTGSAQSFTLSHIFNSAHANYKFVPYTAAEINTRPFSEMNVGYGWKLNVQQTIIDKTISNVDYKVFVDEDGTEHYFYKDSDDATIYKDEDGLGLKIKVEDSSTMTMSDDEDNKKIFKNGYLYQIKDANNNTITIKYGNHANGSAVVDNGVPLTTRHRIVQITQTIVGQSEKIIAILTYNNNGYLTGLTDENSQTTTISYSADRVIGFTHWDGTQAKYTYDSSTGNMTYAYDDEAKYGIQYSYGANKQVSSFSEFVYTTANYGNVSAYEYGTKNYVAASGKGKTVVRDTGSDRTTNTADDIVTTYLFDSYGRTANTYSSNSILGNNNIPFRLYGTSISEYTPTKTAGQNCKSNNRISGEALTGSMPINYVSNPGAQFEPSNGWTVSSGSIYRSGEKHTGNNSFALDHAYISSANVLMYQTKALRAGSYTFSAYVKTAFTSTPGSGGAFLSVYNSNLGLVKSRVVNETTNTQIENGWERISVSFTATGDEAYYQISVYLNDVTGVAYFDDFQLEECEGASNSNLLNNSTIEDCSSPTVATSWTARDGTVERTYDKKISGGASLKVVSNINTYSVAKNVVDIYDSAVNSSYVISGWAWAKSVPLKTGSEDGNDAPKFKIFAKLNYTDNTSAFKDVSFNPDIRGEWQYVSLVFVPSKAVKTIEVCCFYANNNGVAYFDNISLIREESQTYKYDSDGKLTKVNSTGVNGDEDYTYSGANLISSTYPGAGTYKYQYKTSGNTHLLEKVTNEMGTANTSDDFTMEVSHDTAGNTTSTKTYAGAWNASSTKYLTTSAVYSGKNYITSQTDANNITTTNTYNNKHQVSSVTVPASETLGGTNATTNYTYYDSGRNKMTYMSGKIAVTSSYSNGVLSGISRGGYNNGTSFTQTYGFNHDAWGNTTAELVGNQVVASYTFGNGNGNLLRITYSNGNTVDYTYDNLDRVETVSYNNVPKYSYYYDGSGSLSRVIEEDTHTEIDYQYDGIGRLVSQVKYDMSGAVPVRIDAEHFTYDTYSRNDKVITEANGKTNTATYTYNNNSGDVFTLYNKYDVNTATNGDKLTYTYDTLNRLSQKRLEHHANTAATLDTRYTYKTISGNRTSNQISELKYVIGNSSSYWNKYNYTYDQAGNIKQTSTGQGDNVVKYFYDVQGQLVMEENNTLNKTYAYTYDTCGNIRQKRIYDATGFTSETDLSYATPTETINYSYTDANFKDKLTNYNGTNINYDNVGNPLNWTGGATLTWQNGRELANYSKSGTSISYTYNGDGLRSSKTVNGTKYTYIYNGSLLAMQKWGNKSLRFIYDNNGSPYAVVYNNGSTDTVYYYIKNLQGDVTMIVDQNIGIVAKYTYDAWGKLLSVTNASGATLTSGIGIDNPIRYRGYYYDSETNWYYLGSRYYDPSICRFINADDVSTVTNSKTITDKNLYAYCDNNPVNRTDDEGDFWNFIVGAIVGAVVSAVTTVAEAVKEDGWGALTSGKTWAKAGVSAACGAIGGAVASLAGPGVGGSIAIALTGAATGGAEEFCHQMIDNNGDINKVNYKKVAYSSFSGAVSATISGRNPDFIDMKKEYGKITKGLAKEGRRANRKYATKQTTRLISRRNTLFRNGAIAALKIVSNPVANKGIKRMNRGH